MPTGSLCAERCAIGQALARDPALRREHMKAIAVLSVPLDSEEEGEGAAPAPVPSPSHQEFLDRPRTSAGAAAASAVLHQHLSPPPTPHRLGGAKREREGEGPPAPLATLSTPKRARGGEEELMASPTSPSYHLPPQVSSVSFASVVGEAAAHGGAEETALPPPPARAASAASEGEMGKVLLNPLPPCGSCGEWLKKIAEVNPDFRVITFTDTTCGTVFVKAVS